jgi:hypothetical protein
MAENTSVVDALLSLVQAQLLDVNTCLPGVVVSYANGRASVQPTGKKRFADGDALDYPIIHDARVCWPTFAGGQAGIKGPVMPGDRCLLVFSQQATDGTDDRRMFDLSDCHAVMCDLGNTGAATDNTSLTMYYGAANVQILPGGAMALNAPGGLAINAPLLTLNAAITQGAPMGGGTATASFATDVTAAGKSLVNHRHNETGSTTTPPI